MASSTKQAAESVVSDIMKEGFQDIAIKTTAGLGVGFLAGLVLARGGGGNTRKIIAGLGGGAGLGQAWTKCSMELEEALGVKK